MQLLAQGFEVLVIGGMEDAQGVVIAADDDAGRSFARRYGIVRQNVRVRRRFW